MPAGSAWCLLRMHQALVKRLGEAVQEILNSRAYQQLIPKGSTTETWINTYHERHVH